MELSIVILHHGNAKAATRSLQALTKAWLPDQTEVFVVNNGKPGCNPEIPFDGDFDLHYLEIENRGYPQGNNVAMQRAKGKFLCILTDVVVEPDTFKVLLGYLQAHPQVGIVAPRLVYPEGGVQDNYRVFPRLLVQLIKRTFLRRWFLPQVRHYLMWDKDPQKSEAVDWLTGAMQVFTRECWEKIGPKDERYFLFMSDVDICRTAWDRGFEVHFVGETQATHEQARLSGGGILDVLKKRVVRIHIVDAMKYYWKYRGKKIPKTQ